MRTHRKLFILLTAATVTVYAGLLSAAGSKRAYTPEDLSRVKDVSQPALSPDGRWVAYVVGEADYAADQTRSDIYLVPADGSASPRRLTFSGRKNHAPAWSTDSRLLGFLSDRGGDDLEQVCLLSVDQPGEARAVGKFPGGVEDFIFDPSGKYIIFAARVYPDNISLDTLAVRDSLKKTAKRKALVHEHLLYRHWNIYWDGKATHLFRMDLEGAGTLDLTPDLKYDALNYWLASAGREFDLSADGKWLYFAGDQHPDQAVSYNTEVYRAPVEGGKLEKLTDNPAADNLPRPSPDGRYLAWRATRRPYYESDQYDLMVLDLRSGAKTNLTGAFDRSVEDISWSSSGDTLFFQAEDAGDIDYFAVGSGGGPVVKVIGKSTGAGSGYHMECQTSRDGKFFVFLHRSFAYLYEVARFDRSEARLSLITGHNDSLWSEVYLPEGEDIYYRGADGATIHGMLFKPIDFDPVKKYPLLVRIHGGPQQMFGRAFRHEYALFAGSGYAVFACNPRGSTGFGQQLTDQIRGDWGGRVIEDIRLGVRKVLKENSFLDPGGVVGWGDSFGGFAANWLEGHNQDGLFTALVSHAGDADQWSSYGSTEELWFPEWELFGAPWQNPALYEKLSPIRYAKNFKTPLLLTHGDLDYRVPITGSEQMFTACQRQGVPSKFIRFPDEGHWILKPQNKKFWYESILEWSDRWCRNKP